MWYDASETDHERRMRSSWECVRNVDKWDVSTKIRLARTAKAIRNSNELIRRSDDLLRQYGLTVFK